RGGGSQHNRQWPGHRAPGRGLHGVKATSTHNARKCPLRVNFPAFRVPAKRPATPAASVRPMPLRCEFLCREKGETMPTLTIEDIRNNPWNVLTHRLPERPDELLLEIAQ